MAVDCWPTTSIAITLFTPAFSSIEAVVRHKLVEGEGMYGTAFGFFLFGMPLF
jgi:hypothetical protein